MRNGVTKALLAVFSGLLAFSTLAGAGATEGFGNARDPASVAEAYLRAVYARDFSEAYRYVSSEDQRARTRAAYLRQRGPLNGFALKIAKMLAATIVLELTPRKAAPDRTLLTARYRAPDPEKLAVLMRDWSGYRLNSLSAAERKQIIEAIETKTRDKSLDMVSGEEKLVLVKEGDEWRIFLDWARGVTIPLRAILKEPNATDILNVSLSARQTVAQPGEVFEITVKIRNLSQKPLILRILHLVQPEELAEYLEIVQCGFLLPVRLPPGSEQEYSGTYLLRGSLPEGVHQLNLDYDFRPISEK
jgi:hypothetical protein